MYSFPLHEREMVIKKDHANLQKEGEAFHGALYLTDERLVFVGYMGDLNNKYMYETPLEHIQELIPGKTFYLIPNVIQVVTIRGVNYQVIIRHRDEWIQSIQVQKDRGL